MALAPGMEQYDLARKRAKQQNTQELDRQRDALGRRFAQLGNLNSGARMKIEQQTEDEASRRLSDANEGINAQEQGELQRRRELQESRDFTTSERLGTQGFYTGERQGSEKFAAGESALTRKQVTDESALARQHTSGESDLARRHDYTMGDLTRQHDASQSDLNRKHASGETDLARQHEAGQTDLGRVHDWKKFAVAADQFERTFAEDIRVTNENLRMANIMLKEGSKGILQDLADGIFGEGTVAPEWFKYAANPIYYGNKKALEVAGRGRS